MFQKKKVKISNVKRSQHVKNKKNYTKPLKKKEQPNAKSGGKDKKSSGQKVGGSIATNKIFGKPTVDKTKRRDKRNEVGKLLPMPPPPPTQHKKQKDTAAAADDDKEDDDDEEYTAQDMLDMMDEDDRDEYVSGAGNKAKKRKRAEDADDVNRAAHHFEKQYAALTNTESLGKKRMVDLLPIKTKSGDVVTRQTEVDDDDECPEPEDELEPDDDEDVEPDSDDDIVRDAAVRRFYSFVIVQKM